MAQVFPDVPKIQYGGPKSRNPLEFKHYNPDEVVDGKTMKEHLAVLGRLLAYLL